MQKIFSIFSVLLFCLGLATYTIPAKVLAEDTPAPANLVISEVQTGGCDIYDESNPDICDSEDGQAEFIEFYNPLIHDIDVTGWKVDYISSSGKTITPLYTFDGKAIADSYILLSHGDYYQDVADGEFGIGDSKTSGMLAKSGGHVQIKDDLGQIVDLVGWGDAEPIGSWPSTSAIPPGFSIKRLFPDNPLFALGVIFDVPTKPVEPQGGGYVLNQSSNDGEDNSTGDNQNSNDNSSNDSSSNDASGGQGAGPLSSCNGVKISELLPNPAGSDIGHEFIELHNPTGGSIDLIGCKLQTSANTKLYEFTEGRLQPGQYSAFYNDKTGLTLANSGGGKVYLIDTDDTEIYQADYPSDLDDDISWSLINGSWEKTFSVTPNKANELLESKPCPAGQIRNPDTNRCINITEEAAGLSSCPEGKERNPATNRCRNITSLASALKACATDQVRNPVTNRCKKISGSTSTLTPCNPGQERNPQTHRCRKTSAASSSGALNDVKDVLSVSSKNTANWVATALAVLGALSYAVFEWRNEILEQLGILRSKFS